MGPFPTLGPPHDFAFKGDGKRKTKPEKESFGGPYHNTIIRMDCDIAFSQCSSISHAVVLSLEFTCTRIDCNVMVVFSVLEQEINEGSVATLKGQHTEAISKVITMEAFALLHAIERYEKSPRLGSGSNLKFFVERKTIFICRISTQGSYTRGQ